ncbi:MAG: GNAT family N-acetyltransferase [Candidatus Omnitrophica bacterium]|nr:GNAT family N-acetyltransferase [Candidatus Omnitrophota bacterium]
MAVEVRSARHHGEVTQACTLAAHIFGTDVEQSRRRQEAWLRLEPCADLRDLVLACEGGEVVGLIRIVNRQFHWSDGMVPAGGLAHVGLHEAYRGRGLGGRMVEAALARLTERHDTLAVLFARRAVDGWYPKFGFVGLGCHPELRVEPAALSETMQPREVQVETGLGSVPAEAWQTLYEASYRELPLSFYRDGLWWAGWEERLAMTVGCERVTRFYMADRLIGYAVSDGERVVEAAADVSWQASCAQALCAQAAEQDEGLALRLPTDHWLMRWLQRLNHTLTIRYAWDGGHMVRLMGARALQSVEAAETGWDARQAVGVARASRSRLEEQCSRLLELLTAAPPAVVPSLPTWSILDEF